MYVFEKSIDFRNDTDKEAETSDNDLLSTHELRIELSCIPPRLDPLHLCIQCWFYPRLQKNKEVNIDAKLEMSTKFSSHRYNRNYQDIIWLRSHFKRRINIPL